MNKIISALSITVLCSCSTTQVKSPATIAGIADHPLPKVNPQSEKPPVRHLTANHQFRHHSVIHVNKSEKDPVENTQEAEQEESFLPRLARYIKQGIASWYGPKFHGKKTATGEIFDMYALTAAHKTLPIPSYAEVTNLKNNRKVIVRINDRGPFVGNRLLDLSYAAAQKLDMDGLAPVEIKSISAEQAIRKMRQTAKEQRKDSLYLTLGSFKSSREAQKLRARIDAKHLAQTRILTSRHRKSKLYTVQIGPIDSQSGIDKLNLQLARLGVTGAEYMSENSQNKSSMIQ